MSEMRPKYKDVTAQIERIEDDGVFVRTPDGRQWLTRQDLSYGSWLMVLDSCSFSDIVLKVRDNG